MISRAIPGGWGALNLFYGLCLWGGRVPQNMQAFRWQKFTCLDGYLSYIKFIVWHFLEKPKCWIFWTKIRNLHLQDTRVCVSLCNWTIDCFKCYRKDQKGHKNFKASSTALWVPSIVGHHILNLRKSNFPEKENPNFIARISNKLGQKINAAWIALQIRWQKNTFNWFKMQSI